jgi:hypothetical protein
MSADGQPATTAQQRTADVFLAHTPSGAEGASLVSCWCGRRFDTFAHHAEHVAAAVVAALELTEEHRVARSICDMADPGIPERRLVGPWRTTPTEAAEK